MPMPNAIPMPMLMPLPMLVACLDLGSCHGLVAGMNGGAMVTSVPVIVVTYSPLFMACCGVLIHDTAIVETLVQNHCPPPCFSCVVLLLF